MSILTINRRVKKALARSRRRDRKELVHAAGCMYRGVGPCASISAIEDSECRSLIEPGVRIPRSLRKKYFGGRVRT